jgi:ABC-type branched-subunit amino acid transport system ATPase component
LSAIATRRLAACRSAQKNRRDLARFILRIKRQLGIAMIGIEHDMQMVAEAQSPSRPDI